MQFTQIQVLTPLSINKNNRDCYYLEIVLNSDCNSISFIDTHECFNVACATLRIYIVARQYFTQLYELDIIVCFFEWIVFSFVFTIFHSFVYFLYNKFYENQSVVFKYSGD